MTDPEITLTIRRVNGRVHVEGAGQTAEGRTIEDALQQWIDKSRAEHKRMSDGLAKIRIPE